MTIFGCFIVEKSVIGFRKFVPRLGICVPSAKIKFILNTSNVYFGIVWNFFSKSLLFFVGTCLIFVQPSFEGSRLIFEFFYMKMPGGLWLL